METDQGKLSDKVSSRSSKSSHSQAAVLFRLSHEYNVPALHFRSLRHVRATVRSTTETLSLMYTIMSGKGRWALRLSDHRMNAHKQLKDSTLRGSDGKVGIVNQTGMMSLRSSGSEACRPSAVVCRW